MQPGVPSAQVSPAHVSPRLPPWIVVAGTLAGLLLTLLAPMLPERVQTPGLYVGVAMSLGCIAAALLLVAKDAHLEWRGISPAVGILIGVLTIIGPFGLDHLRSRHSEGSPTTARAVPVAMPAAAAMPAAQIRDAQIPQAQPSAGSYAPLDEERPNRPLDEVSQSLTKARTAIQSVTSATIMIARRPRGNAGDTFTSQLATAATDLASAQESLDQLGAQLPAVLEDTTPLSELNSALRQYIYALQSPSSGSTDQGSLRTAASNANRWIADCEERLANLQGSAAPAT